MNRNEAEENLRVIRSLMEKATVYRAISAPTALVAGVLAIAASYIGMRLGVKGSGDSGADSDIQRITFPLVWFIVLVAVAGANGFFLHRDARRRGEKFISHGMKAALIALLPSHLTAGVLSVVFQMVPAVLVLVWIIFHGVGLLATSHFSPRSMMILGWAFLLAGIASSVVWAYFPAAFPEPSILMGTTFGGFHLVYAALTWPRGNQAA